VVRSIAALALLASLVCADAAAAAERCKVPRGSDTIAKSSYTWVYRPFDNARRDPDFAEKPTYACNRRTGRRFVLDNPRLETYVDWSGSYGRHAFPPRLAGTHLAYALTTYEGSEGEYKALYALDLATAKKRKVGVWDESDGTEFLSAFYLRSSGAVAWSAVEEGEGTIGLWGSAGKQYLDRGRAVDADSFAVSRDGRRVYWTNADQPRTALVR
jgi:hypothetical protein